jgi:hypothetical protein
VRVGGAVSRRGGAAPEPPVWTETSADRPCPACGRARGCSVLEDEGFVRCTAVLSPWPVAGGGWLHRVVPEGVRGERLADEVVQMEGGRAWPAIC